MVSGKAGSIESISVRGRLVKDSWQRHKQRAHAFSLYAVLYGHQGPAREPAAAPAIYCARTTAAAVEIQFQTFDPANLWLQGGKVFQIFAHTSLSLSLSPSTRQALSWLCMSSLPPQPRLKLVQR